MTGQNSSSGTYFQLNSYKIGNVEHTVLINNKDQAIEFIEFREYNNSAIANFYNNEKGYFIPLNYIDQLLAKTYRIVYDPLSNVSFTSPKLKNIIIDLNKNMFLVMDDLLIPILKFKRDNPYSRYKEWPKLHSKSNCLNQTNYIDWNYTNNMVQNLFDSENNKYYHEVALPLCKNCQENNYFHFTAVIDKWYYKLEK